MRCLRLDSQSVLDQLRDTGSPVVRSRSLGWSLWVGTAGFTAASLAVYALWAFAGRWFYGRLGEAGAYAVWAAVFILLAGASLNALVISPRSLPRFYSLFAVAFAAYALCWSVSWFALRGRAGEWLGSLTGTAALGWILCVAFDAPPPRWRILAVLFVAHSLGYFAGSFLFDFFRSETAARMFESFLSRSGRSTAGKLSWGLAYGIGFGLGLGYAIHTCQRRLREELGRAH
jgi:hypothetical protein